MYIKLIIDIRILRIERPFLGKLFLYRLLVLTLYILQFKNECNVAECNHSYHNLTFQNQLILFCNLFFTLFLCVWFEQHCNKIWKRRWAVMGSFLKGYFYSRKNLLVWERNLSLFVYISKMSVQKYSIRMLWLACQAVQLLVLLKPKRWAFLITI